MIMTNVSLCLCKYFLIEEELSKLNDKTPGTADLSFLLFHVDCYANMSGDTKNTDLLNSIINI